MASASSRIVVVHRSDTKNDDVILVRVSQRGKKDLDLALVATEGSSPYVGSIKSDHYASLRAKNYHGSDEEWRTVLSKIFWGKVSKLEDNAIALEGVEAVGSVKEDKEIVITIRKNVKGITQRLGSITLKYDEAQEIELFDWTASAARRATNEEDEVSSYRQKLEGQEKAVKALNQQLEDLIKAKSEHEDALFKKFSELLNTKKLKIRDQQRLLNGLKNDSGTGLSEKATHEAAATDAASPSRAGKRKATGQDVSAGAAATDSDSDDDSGFEKMDVDKIDKADGQSDQGKETPGRSDGTTDDERLPVSRRSPAKQSEKQSQTPQQTLVQDQEPKDPPPRRELPFAGRTPGASNDTGHPTDREESANKQAESEDETEGETDDDEL